MKSRKLTWRRKKKEDKKARRISQKVTKIKMI